MITDEIGGVMGKTTISWTDYSWNPWVGCRKVSIGCENCYMFRDQKRFGTDPTNIRRTTPNIFNQTLKIKEPSKIFVCSWSDFFIEEADEWRDEAWEIIRQTPHLTYQILTKRPENIRARLPHDWGEGWDNVWLGVSIENNEYKARGWDLVRTPAQIKFISAEPLFDWIVLSSIFETGLIDWVIVGGESGPGCRLMDPQWARDIRDGCKSNGVAFFMKQLGGHPDRWENIDQFPEDLRIQEFPNELRKKGEVHANV